MSVRVWKFVVPEPTATGRSFIDLPLDAKILSAGIQHEGLRQLLVVWAAVPNALATTHSHRLFVANTGAEIPGFPSHARFLGTVTSNGIVRHIWDGDA